jgi:hypothetical protein
MHGGVMRKQHFIARMGDNLTITNDNCSKWATIPDSYILESFINSHLHISVHRLSLSPAAARCNAALSTPESKNPQGGYLTQQCAYPRCQRAFANLPEHEIPIKSKPALVF